MKRTPYVRFIVDRPQRGGLTIGIVQPPRLVLPRSVFRSGRLEIKHKDELRRIATVECAQ
jgi:hypothetical protein